MNNWYDSYILTYRIFISVNERTTQFIIIRMIAYTFPEAFPNIFGAGKLNRRPASDASTHSSGKYFIFIGIVTRLYI